MFGRALFFWEVRFYGGKIQRFSGARAARQTDAVASTLLSLVREVVFGIGFALLLPVFFGLNGVLYSMPVSDLLTFVIAAFLIRRTWRELSQPSTPSQS